MFLIPALSAFTADTVVVYLYTNFQYLLGDYDGFWSIKNVSYLLPLSILRLLLLIPYNYHTYSGTRLKLPALYSTIHTISGIVVFIHFIAFSIYAESHFKNDSSGSSSSTTNNGTAVDNVMDDDFVRLFLSSSSSSSSHGGLLIDDQNYDLTTTSFNNTMPMSTTLHQHQNQNHIDERINDSTTIETEYDVIWILLALSLCSIFLHIVILLHVRSTAPSHDAIRQKLEEGQAFGDSSSSNIHRNRKMLAYWIYYRYRKENDVESFDGQDESLFTSKIMKRNIVAPLSPIVNKSNYQGKYALDPDLSISSDSNGTPNDGDLLSEDDDDDETEDLNEFIDAEEGHNCHQHPNNPNNNWSESESERLLMHNATSESYKTPVLDFNDSSFDEDMHFFPTEDDINAFNDSPQSTRRRIRRKRKNSLSSSWRNSRNSLRGLVDIHVCISKQGYDDFLSEIRSRFQEAKREWDLRLDDVFGRMRKNESGTTAIQLPFRQHTPFRALLHLYAHEDVFLNKKLDRAFSSENPTALSFYAPQLLCFLLHNAYLSTGRLEKWILDKCKTDTQFAHQCFWFLRAWCLQGGIYRPEDNVLDDNMSTLESSEAPLDLNKKTQKDVKSNNAALSPQGSEVGSSKVLSRNGSTHSFQETVHSFSEIKGLVKHPSAQDLKKSSGIKLLPEERIAVESLLSKIIDSGEMSTRKSEHSYGLDEQDQMRCQNESQPLKSAACNGDVASKSNGFGNDVGYLTSTSENLSLGLRPKTLSSVRLSEHGEEIKSYFLRTPDFLDSLMAIADDLILEPRSNRTPQLRKRLSELGANMLPSHSIYVPVNGSLHYICRIVASESIAISTKERVPCIIYLEVIDHVKMSDNDEGILRQWFTAPRHPQRHNTIFTKVSKGLKRLRHDIEENHERLFRDLSRDESLPVFVREEEKTEANLPSRTSSLVFKEDWETKVNRIRINSAFSDNPNWRLLPILIKTNDDIRQEQLAAQMIHCMAQILSRAKIPVWLYPYDILALSFRGGIIEAIPDTISIDSMRKKHPTLDLKTFFSQQFGEPGCDSYENAKANFVESLAAYSIVCFLLQLKDRHNGNIMLDNKGHIVHIDFGFYFLSSPGKNSGFESAPFKLTRDFVEVMDGVNSHTFMKFRELCYRTFLELRRNCFQITLLVQMLIEGNEDLDCFRNQPHEAVRGLQERFRLDLNDKACVEYVNSLINDSVENWTTTCYDRYQRWCTGIM